MTARYTIRLSVEDKRGGGSFVRCVDSDDFPIFPERFVDEVTAPLNLGAALMPLDETVRVLKKREFRREWLLAAAKALAAQLADYIEDAEGWHGERRRDIIAEQRGKRT